MRSVLFVSRYVGKYTPKIKKIMAAAPPTVRGRQACATLPSLQGSPQHLVVALDEPGESSTDDVVAAPLQMAVDAVEAPDDTDETHFSSPASLALGGAYLLPPPGSTPMRLPASPLSSHKLAPPEAFAPQLLAVPPHPPSHGSEPDDGAGAACSSPVVSPLGPCSLDDRALDPPASFTATGGDFAGADGASSPLPLPLSSRPLTPMRSSMRSSSSPRLPRRVLRFADAPIALGEPAVASPPVSPGGPASPSPSEAAALDTDPLGDSAVDLPTLLGVASGRLAFLVRLGLLFGRAVGRGCAGPRLA
jgi:hypothetical protein